MRNVIKFIAICIVSGFTGMGIVGLVASTFNFSGSQIQQIKTKYRIKDRSFVKDPVNPAIIRLHDKKGQFFCSGFVVDASYAVTAAHCLSDDLGFLMKGSIQIRDSDGSALTLAKAAGLNHRLDYGVIVGDFSNFNHLEMDASTSFFHPTETKKFSFFSEEKEVKSFKACGYPQGQRDVYCSEFSPKQSYFFQVAGLGQVFPGMSGGPVMDAKTGEAVGVISAMSEGAAIITPVTGILGNFDLEVK